MADVAKNYVFNFDDFTVEFRRNFEQHIRFSPEGRWDVLEIGVLDGRNAVWLLENILVHPDSTYTGIDWHMKPNSLANLNHFNHKSTLIKADSRQAMRWINKKFNLIYIDSNHIAQQCICESALAMGMLKPQGVIVWDDYGNDEFPGVKLAVDNFLECMEEGKDYESSSKIIKQVLRYLRVVGECRKVAANAQAVNRVRREIEQP